MPTVHIVTTDTKSDRYLSVSQPLNAMGFATQPTVVPWSDPEFVEKLSLIPEGRRKGRLKGLLSNAIAQFRAWKRIASDPDSDGDDWGFVMEDDARLHVDIADSHARQVIADFLASCQKHDFAYLGICAPKEFAARTRQPSTYDLETGIASGLCCHAYAIRKKLALTLENDLYSFFGGPAKLVRRALDRRLYRYWSQKRGVPVCGINLVAPGQTRDGHRGIFYQDRRQFESILNSLNNGLDLDFRPSES